MNSTPADSKACWSLFRASSDTRGPTPASTLLTVGSESPARAASFDCDQPRRPRAARSCSILSISKIPLDPKWIITYDPFWIMTADHLVIAKLPALPRKEDIQNGTK